MQIQQHNGPVRTSGAAGQSGSFSIAMNGKAFRVLSDTMYQDKIGSIMREISCNALDSHIMAGTPETPFTLHLPDEFEPWVSFRDYGIGLSPEAVQTVFCVYFQSTKDQSNDAVGAFGLGAKTPFSYTDQFNVTSVYGGRKYMYSAFINGEGIPEIQLMAETETNESNGVEIKIGVEPSDFGAFIAAAKNQLRFFPVKPEVINYANGAEFPFEEDAAILFQNERAKIFNSKEYGRAAIHIIQGPVGYPMDVSQVMPHLSSEDAQFLRTVNEIGMNLYFNIGEIGVTASREGIEYKGITLDSIKSAIASVHADVVQWITTQISTLPTVYEKVKFVNDSLNFRGIMSGLNLDLAPAIRNYNGSYYFLVGSQSFFNKTVQRYDSLGNQFDTQVSGVSISKYSSGFTSSRSSSSTVSLTPYTNERVCIVLRDTNRQPVAKMRHFYETNKISNMWCLQSTGVVFDDAFIEQLKESLGGYARIYKVSEMADPPRVKNAQSRTGYSRPTAYSARSLRYAKLETVSDWTREYDKLEELTDCNGDELETAVYVTVERQRIVNISYVTLNHIRELGRAGLLDIPVYAIRASEVDKLASTNTKWISLENYITEVQDGLKSNSKIARHALAAWVYDSIHEAIGHRLTGLTGLHPRSTLARLSKLKERAAIYMAESGICPNMVAVAGITVHDHPAAVAVSNLTKRVFDKTPMLKYVANHGYGAFSDTDAPVIVDYVNQCYNNA